MPAISLELLFQPVLGAVIGYVTNAVAIRMLFRPLRPWRILGIRVPMTPGVIPAKRAQLARNIGEMVGGHLLTSGDVARAIRDQGFQGELAALLDERVEALLSRDLGPLPSLVPERFRPYFHAGVKILRWRALRQLHAHLASDAFAARFLQAVENSLQPLLARSVADPAGREFRDRLFSLLETVLAAILAEPWVEEWAAATLQAWLATVVREEKSLADLLPEEATAFLLATVEQQTPVLLEKLGGLVEEPAFAEKLAQWLAEAAQRLAAALGPLAGLVSGFLSREKIRKKIREYLTSHGDEVQRLLLDTATREQLAALLRSKAGEWLHAPLAGLVREVPPEKLAQWFAWTAARLAHLLWRPELAQAAVACLRKGIEADGAQSLEQTLRELLGDERLQAGHDWLAGRLLALVRSPATKRLLDDLLIDLVERRLLAHPVGRLADLLPREVRSRINGFLFEQVSDILTREVPPLVDSLGIRDIVARKVDSLDLLRLEALLMGIMQEQFKYINLFGGLLGFLIGLLNLLPLALR